MNTIFFERKYEWRGMKERDICKDTEKSRQQLLPKFFMQRRETMKYLEE